jgi:zinc transport system substrate-binding protein
MEKRRWMAIGVLLAVVCLITVSATYIYYITPHNVIEEQPGEGKIGVVVTLLPQADFVENVGRDKVDVTVMVGPGESPHTYAPTSNQLVDLSKAEMYVKVGSGVEFELVHMDDIIAQNPDMLIVDSSVGIGLMGTDPHIWNSPVNVKIMVKNICDGLIQVDPDNTNFYTENRDDYLKELDILNGYIHYKLDGFTNRTFMIYHPAFGYFANEYGLTQLAVEHGGKEPTLKVLQDCTDKAIEYNLQYVFVAPQFATVNCEIIASKIGGQIAPMNPLPKNYIANMGRIADALALEFED